MKASVCGHDVVKESSQVRSLISYVPQEMAVDVKLTGRENVDLFARLYRVKDRHSRVEEALRMMGP
jgi:ABC-2 type transport system ATP-binding protein